MRRCPPNTIHRYLELPYTQRIQTHISHRHNTTHTSISWSKPTTHSPPTPPTPPQPKHRHTPNIPPVLTRLVKPKPNPLIHSPPLSIHSAPCQTHTHLTHSTNSRIPRITLSHSTSAALDTRPEPRIPPHMPCTHHNHTSPIPTPALSSPSHTHTLSAYTHATQTTSHVSQSEQPPHPHRVPRQPHRQTKDDHMTPDTLQGHRNLIILQVNINGIKTTLHSLQQTYLPPSIHTTHDFKWSWYTLTSLSISQLQTFIYLLETAHPRTTKQPTRTYNTANSTSQTYHAQSSPEI